MTYVVGNKRISAAPNLTCPVPRRCPGVTSLTPVEAATGCMSLNPNRIEHRKRKLRPSTEIYGVLERSRGSSIQNEIRSARTAVPITAKKRASNEVLSIM